MERKHIENKHRLLETHGTIAKEPAVTLLESQKQRKEGLKGLKKYSPQILIPLKTQTYRDRKLKHNLREVPANSHRN